MTSELAVARIRHRGRALIVQPSRGGVRGNSLGLEISTNLVVNLTHYGYGSPDAAGLGRGPAPFPGGEPGATTSSDARRSNAQHSPLLAL